MKKRGEGKMMGTAKMQPSFFGGGGEDERLREMLLQSQT